MYTKRCWKLVIWLLLSRPMSQWREATPLQRSWIRDAWTMGCADESNLVHGCADEWNVGCADECFALRSWSTLDQSRWFHQINHFCFGVPPQSIRIIVSLDLWFSHVNSEPTPLDDSMREGTISSMMSSAEDHGFQTQGSRLLRFCPRTRSWGCRRDVFGATLEVSMLM